MSSTDKIIQIAIAILLAIVCFTKTISDTLALTLGASVVVFIITRFVSFCPLYSRFGISTRKKV